MYKEMYNEELQRYKSLLTEYNEKTESEEFFTKRNSIPFNILPAVNKCEQFALYHKLSVNTPHPHMTFYSADEASVFFEGLKRLFRQVGSILEDAAYLNDVFNKGKEINDLVDKSDYLTEGFKVSVDEDLVFITRQALKELPKYKGFITKGLLYDFVESCIASLDVNGIKSLVEKGTIKADDLDNIHLSMPEVNGYDDKVKELCKMLNHNEPLIEKHEVKVVGVTFENEDGSSRQDIIKELSEVVASGQNVTLKAESYMFTPEVGEPEPAIRIRWGNKIVGNIGKSVAKELTEKYKNPQYLVDLIKITGGDNVSFGMTVNLGVVSPEYIKAPEKNEKEETNDKNGFTHEI